MNATVVTPGFGHRPRVSAQVQNMKYSTYGKKTRTPSSANSLGNMFENYGCADFGDYFTPSARASYGYPLDEDGNYPENARWF